jgi:hypothetical protein
MAQTSESIFEIPRAASSVSMRLSLVLFVRGPLRAHAAKLGDLFECMRVTAAGKSLRRYRLQGDNRWQDVSAPSPSGDFGTLFNYPVAEPGSWGVELAERSDDPSAGEDNFMQIADLVPSFGVERASYVRMTFGERTPIAEIASLANWSINNFPLWWGSAGWCFHHVAGRVYPAYAHIAAMAKRYWAVQIQNLTALQWDALRGMPGVNWLTLIGQEFAVQNGLKLESLMSDVGKGNGVFQRGGAFGLVLAAGSKPIKGDVNVGEGVGAYKQIAKIIAPLLLTEQASLGGPFDRPEVTAAWLGRFQDSRSWVECDISG